MLDQEPPKEPLSFAWPVIGLVTCVFLFVVALVRAFLSIFTSSWGNESISPFLRFILLAPVAGFAGCLVWLVVVLVRRSRQG